MTAPGESTAQTTSAWSAFLWAIGQQESGGNYSAHNSIGALGKYQVMTGNVAAWSKKVLGYVISPSQFLNSPALQEQIVGGILGGYYSKYGAAGAASAWYSGDPTKAGSTAPQNGGPSIASYVASVLALMRRAPGGGSSTPPPPSGGGSSSTPPPAGTPSPTIQVVTGWHIPGTPWDIPNPGDAISGVEGAAASVSRAITRIAIMGPIVLAGVALVTLGMWKMTSGGRAAVKDDMHAKPPKL